LSVFRRSIPSEDVATSLRSSHSARPSFTTAVFVRTSSPTPHISIPMKVLLVGSGGREHALAWKLKQSKRVTDIYIAPGNPGTEELGENIPAETSQEILEWLKSNRVDLVVIGPDQYLAEGLTDSIQELGIKVFGPTKLAAEIEWSKSYAKQFMEEECIPTARHKVFNSSDEAKKYVSTQSFPLVIKADGLAAGKGVVIAQDLAEAVEAIEGMLDKKTFGESGARIVIEEYLEGREISVHAFCDGNIAVLFPASKDHKRIFEGDTGPNTGGMGTVAPVPVSQEEMDLIRDLVILPTLTGLKKRGQPFNGLLFPGIMLTSEGPKVIEFNARFGDPETQSYMLLLETDLFEILDACASGTLEEIDIRWSNQFACCIILAAKGYPARPEKGAPITILPFKSENTVIFHAGTTLSNGELRVSGGRVLGVSARGETLKEALDKAYKKIDQIDFQGKQFREDIGESLLT